MSPDLQDLSLTLKNPESCTGRWSWKKTWVPFSLCPRWANTLTRPPITQPRCRLPPEQSLKLVSSEQALKELGLNEHQLRFTCRVQLHDPHSDSDTLHRIYTHLKRSEHLFQTVTAPLKVCKRYNYSRYWKISITSLFLKFHYSLHFSFLCDVWLSLLMMHTNRGNEILVCHVQFFMLSSLCSCMQRVERLHHPTPPWWYGDGGVHCHQSVLVRWGAQHQSPASVLELPGNQAAPGATPVNPSSIRLSFCLSVCLTDCLCIILRKWRTE